MIRQKTIFFLIFLLLISFAGATTYYGQVLIKNNPVQGLEVTAEWFDQNGIYHKSLTRTLTKTEAARRGDENLAGYYFFEGGSIYSLEGTNVIFSFSMFPYNLIIRSLPNQNIVRLDTISFQYALGYSNQTAAANQTPENVTLSKDEITRMIISNVTAPVEIASNSTIFIGENMSALIIGEKITEKINATPRIDQQVEAKPTTIVRDSLVVLAIVVFFGLVLGIGYFFVKQGTMYIDHAIEEYVPPTPKPKKIADTRIKSVTSKLIFVNINDSMNDALTQLAGTGSNCVIILKEEEYFGYIKEKSLISYDGEPDAKIADNPILIVKEDISIDSKKDISDAHSLMEKLGVTRLVVKEGNKISGQISIMDLLRLFSGIKKLPYFRGRQDIPIIRDALDKECPSVDKDTRMNIVIELISKHSSGIVLITDDRYIGEITTGDIVSGIIKYGKKLRENKAGLSMGSMHALSPDSDILDANEYIIERGNASYPVIINDTLLGVVSASKLLGEIIRYMKNN